LNALIKDKHESKLSIIAWIHSRTEINSIDLHTQKTWSNECSDILEIFVQVAQDGSVENYDFYGLTRQGDRMLTKCCKSGDKSHDDCNRKSFYKSYLDYVTFTESPFEIILCDVFEMVIVENSETVPSDDSQTDESDDPMPEEEFWRRCKGCNKTFDDSNKFCMHVSHYRCKCKHSYGDELQEWKDERKKTSNTKRQRKFHKNNPEKKSQTNKKHHENHREENNLRSKAYHENHREENNLRSKNYHKGHKQEISSRKKKYNLSIQNGEFAKRYLKFKNETKDGPIFVCNCCRRVLFKRGMYHNHFISFI